MDIFLNQLILFYSNNATNLHHLTTHSTTVLTYKMAIVLRTQIRDVSSRYVFCSSNASMANTDCDDFGHFMAFVARVWLETVVNSGGR